MRVDPQFGATCEGHTTCKDHTTSKDGGPRRHDESAKGDVSIKTIWEKDRESRDRIDLGNVSLCRHDLELVLVRRFFSANRGTQNTRVKETKEQKMQITGLLIPGSTPYSFE